MTIFTLGATGILFIVVATILSCMNPSTIAEQQIQEDIRVSLDSWEDGEALQAGIDGINEKEWKAGDKVHLNFTDGENTVEKEFEIAAIVDAPYCLAGYYFTMPSGTLQSFCQTNLREAFEIEVESGKEDAAAEAVEKLIANQEFLEI